MPRILRPHVPGTVFHIYTRGNFRQDIFLGTDDWDYFQNRLAKIKALRPFRLYAYALMTNHLHLLMEALETPLSDILHMLLQPHARRINLKLARTGHLFQSRYQSVLATRDAYLQQLVRYIHLNPVKAGMVANPEAWPYSGHSEYLGTSDRGLVDTEFILSTFHSDPMTARAAYRDFVNDGIGENIELEVDEFSYPLIVAPPPAAPMVSIDRPSLQEFAVRVGSTAEILRAHSRFAAVVEARKGFIESAFRAGYSVAEIAEFLGFTRSAVSRSLRRLFT
ncbi:MAG: transposase [Elusimicrobia bacterium]|nr:transposase [Elusimicrobiota bacterium]